MKEMDWLPEVVNDLAQLVLMCTLSNSRLNFDSKYQMAKQNMHVNLFFAQKPSFLFAKTIAEGKGLERQLRARLTVFFQG